VLSWFLIAFHLHCSKLISTEVPHLQDSTGGQPATLLPPDDSGHEQPAWKDVVDVLVPVYTHHTLHTTHIRHSTHAALLRTRSTGTFLLPACRLRGTTLPHRMPAALPTCRHAARRHTPLPCRATRLLRHTAWFTRIAALPPHRRARATCRAHRHAPLGCHAHTSPHPPRLTTLFGHGGRGLARCTCARCALRAAAHCTHDSLRTPSSLTLSNMGRRRRSKSHREANSGGDV